MYGHGTGQLVYICHAIILQPLHWAHHQWWLFSMLQRIDLTNLICLMQREEWKITSSISQCLPFLYITSRVPPLSMISFSYIYSSSLHFYLNRFIMLVCHGKPIWIITNNSHNRSIKLIFCPSVCASFFACCTISILPSIRVKWW